MAEKIKPKESWRLTWFGGIVVVLAIVVTTTVSWLLYGHTVNLLTDNLRQRLLSIAITQAANIDHKDIAKLQTENDWKKPEWKTIVSSLKKVKDNNPNIVFIYIFRKKSSDPTQMEFVADAESINPYANLDSDPSNDVDANKDGQVEPDGADQLQWPGQDYPTPPEETFKAYEGPLTNSELYSDAYGQVLTGYAPITDNNGKVVAILGVDIKANDFLTVTKQTLYPFLMFIIFLVLAIIILSFALIKLWNKQIEVFAELDRQKDELLGIVAHQLFTPVTAVKWAAEELLSNDGTPIPKEKKEWAKTIESQTVQLADLISMILDVSRIQLGKMQVKKDTLDLNEFFKEILEAVEPRIQEKQTVFEKSLPKTMPVVLLDKRYTRMTIENLLTNAVKYTPEKGKVNLKVDIHNDVFTCTVTDTGCGIPKQDQDKIFGKLYRASNVRNSSIDGNGFGLYVAKGAIESQGGTISFQSQEGKGTTFTVTLPLTYPTLDMKATAEVEGAGVGKLVGA